MRVTQNVNPTASARRTKSSSVNNLVMLLMMDWHAYRHVGMTPTMRDRTIAGLRDGSVKPEAVCEYLGIQADISDPNALLDEAKADLERVLATGANVLGSRNA